MKIIMSISILIFLLISSVMANSFYIGGVFYKNGALTAPDSIHVTATYRPSLTVENFTLEPSSGVYDSLISRPSNADEEVNLLYAVFFNTDSVMVTETVRLKWDSTHYLATFFETAADSTRRLIERDGGHLASLAYFWGTCDSCLQQYYPLDGTTPKDSVTIKTSDGTLKMTIIYKNQNVSTVLDSVIVVHP